MALEKDEDVALVGSLLEQFWTATESQVAKELLDNWPESANLFIKVFPFEYQRALKMMAEASATSTGVSNAPPPDSVSPVAPSHKVKDIEDIVPDAAVEIKRQDLDKNRGFIKYDREFNFYRPAEKRMKDWEEIYNSGQVRRGLRVQAARCMDCGVPFCQSSYGCPLGNVIPKWNDLVFQNKWKEALDQLLQTNNFPEFTGRVCPAPCESACVLGINAPSVTIKSIECAIIDYAFEHGWIKPEVPSIRTGKKVAIVGSGPAGLACAQQLNKVTSRFKTTFL